MQNILKIAMVAGALGLAAQAKAVEYSITFSGTWGVAAINANGTVDVGAGGLADGGSLNVTTGPNQGSFNFQPVLSFENYNGDNTGNDNLVYVNNLTDFLDIGGLSFGNRYAGYGLWDNGSGQYELWGYNYPSPPNTGYGVPDAIGTATLTAVVPDGGLTAGLLGGALLGLGALRRKLQV
jgi:hypothetical protein